MYSPRSGVSLLTHNFTLTTTNPGAQTRIVSARARGDGCRTKQLERLDERLTTNDEQMAFEEGQREGEHKE
jgi:hypothetical protein